jgi:hypothetical protein
MSQGKKPEEVGADTMIGVEEMRLLTHLDGGKPFSDHGISHGDVVERLTKRTAGNIPASEDERYHLSKEDADENGNPVAVDKMMGRNLR